MSCLQLTPKPFLIRTHPKLRTAAFRSKSLTLAVRLKPPLHYFFSTVSCSLKSPSENSDTKTAAFIHSSQNADVLTESRSQNESLNFELRSPNFQANLFPAPKLSLSDKAFFLLAFIACTTSVAFTGLVVAAVPTLYAMGRAAISLSKLADTAREELPSTMAAIRLSGMEISDLTLELSDLSQEIADGVSKSAQAVQAAEAGIRQIGSLARQRTTSMIQERANLSTVSLKPVVAGAAKRTSRALGQATKSIMNMISGGELNLADEDGNNADS